MTRVILLILVPTFIILKFTFFSSTPMRSPSSSQICHNDVDKQGILNLAEDVKESYFSASLYDLSDTQVSLVFKKLDDTVYLKTNAMKFIKNSNRGRFHEILVNEKLLNCPPSKSALRGILAHEFMHIYDYRNVSRTKLGLMYLKVSKYERYTDKRVLDLNRDELAHGLITYREWIYDKIKNIKKTKVRKKVVRNAKTRAYRMRLETDKELERRIQKSLKKKRKNYYTPTEIKNLYL